MKILAIPLALSAIALAGCSTGPRTPDYQCPLESVQAAKCASMQDAYKASRQSSGQPQRQSVFDKRNDNMGGENAQPYFQGQASNYPEPGQQGMAVFSQPKVMRVWTAPYVDADGNLRSGEYTYFSTPGKWNYGDMKKPGAASGIFEPARPGNLGFNPVVQQPKSAGNGGATTNAAPPKPAEPANNTGGVGQPAAANAPADSTTSITQPYQRLAK